MAEAYSNLTVDEWTLMGLAILRGRDFEAAVKRGVPDTPAARAAFERLRTQLAEMSRNGVAPEWPFD